MEIICHKCDRAFLIEDDQEIVPQARCACGARIQVTTEGLGHVGKYVLLKSLAMGGMGEIFEGRVDGLAGFERKVAIKKMLPHLSADSSFINMMVKEAKLTVKLNHPNIVQVYDLDKEGSEYYIAMELVEGVDVAKLLQHCRRKRVRPPLKLAIHIVINVLRGLSYAHSLKDAAGEPMGILHRDITPQNILITSEGFVKITDFGIAKARNEISSTQPGMIKGKLGYIAPEQLTKPDVDHRVDLFCCGILLWEILACRRLFKGATEIDTFRLIADTVVPPLSPIRDDIPEAVEQVLAKALAKDPNERYGDAEDFIQALNKTIFPTTADDCLVAAKSFYESMPELFARQSADGERQEQDEKTVTEDLVDIRTLGRMLDTSTRHAIQGTEKRSGGSPLIWLVPIFLLLGALGGFGAWKAGIFAPQAPPTPEITQPGEVAQAKESELSVEEVQLIVDSKADALSKCYEQGSKSVRKMDKAPKVELVIAQNGAIAGIKFKDKLGKKVERCLRAKLRDLEFRKLKKAKMEAVVGLPIPAESFEPPPPSVAQNRTPPPPPKNESLKAAEIQQAVVKNQGGFLRCFSKLGANAPKLVNAKIEIGQNGKVSVLQIKPSLGQDNAQSCLENTLKGMRFRRHPDVGYVVTIPLRIQTTGS